MEYSFPSHHLYPNSQEEIEYVSDDKKNFSMPSLILLDVKMPIMNGFEVLKWLKSNKKYKTIPVVILTTSGLSVEEIGKYWRFVSNSCNTSN